MALVGEGVKAEVGTEGLRWGYRSISDNSNCPFCQ